MCNEIMVKLKILSISDRGWSIPTVVVQCVLVLITVGRCSPRGLVSMLADRVLLGRKVGDDSLGTCQHGDQCSGCPVSTPNLAWLQRPCPGTTQELAAWGPTLTRRCYGAKGQRLAATRVGHEAVH